MANKKRKQPQDKRKGASWQKRNAARKAKQEMYASGVERIQDGKKVVYRRRDDSSAA